METYICYLPFRGELGWYLMSFVRMIHGDPRPKIICLKRGHECLFPGASFLFYDWQDIPDDHKAGVVQMDDESTVQEKVQAQFPNKEIQFISPNVINWNNRHSFYHSTFKPSHTGNFGLKVDVVITPRKRKIDVLRNWDCDNWQKVVDELTSRGITVGLCGTQDTSCDLQGVLYKSYNYVDIDSDVELMNNAKLVVTQESGLQYLSFMCERPTICVGHYHGDLGADLYRNKTVFFKQVNADPEKLVQEINNYLESHK